MGDLADLARSEPFSLLAEPPAYAVVDISIDEFLGSRRRILGKKLEVFVSEIAARLAIRKQNSDAVGWEKYRILKHIEFLDHKALYGHRAHTEKTVFYQQLFQLSQELRKEEVECWKDIVQVMRDLLFTWEGYEQAKARGRFLNAGGQAQDSLRSPQATDWG